MAGGGTTGISDIFIIGGGVNGCGIARDAAGRGLTVVLAEMGDLAQATSSASTKLFHGGLRYLEYFEVRLVRESLKEREVLLAAMPHISWPMRFILPYHKDMRFEIASPVSRLLARVMPWSRGQRPAWLIRLGLFLYDRLGGLNVLPGTTTLDLARRPEGAVLDRRFKRAFEYSDCWVEDSRLVVLNARDAEARGAKILTRTAVICAHREDGLWQIETEDRETGLRRTHPARMLVNAAGPWAGKVLTETLGIAAPSRVRLVRGSHIVTKRLYDHDKCYFLQGADGRIIFAIPYETDFTLIGTTDIEHPGPDAPAVCTDAETNYLIEFANLYLRQPISRADVVWSYAGVRPLYDDGASTATAATRDYVLTLDEQGAPLVNVFGGKITTYRRLAESVLAQAARFFPAMPGPWTAGVALPGGDLAVDGVPDLLRKVQAEYPFLSRTQALRLCRAYGTEIWAVLGGASSEEDLGRHFGAGLTEREVVWLMTREYARTAEDILWRRGKLGLRLKAEQVAVLDTFMADQRSAIRTAAE